ncbi:MAG: hypothetical protein JXR91_06820 [Deltaproteobacteria bacterium]|nr:hypothetical protein [Deltaproteobacteria bacterium]
MDEYCIDASIYCPWVFLENGTAWTTQSLLACAQDWETFDCDDVLLGKRPACALPGSYPAGERCRTSHQCASRVCVSDNFFGQYDGTCANLVPTGGTCDTDNVCSAGDSCVKDVCIPNTLPVLEDDDYPLGKVGEPCMNNADCVEPLFCQWVDNGEEIGECALPPSAPDACGLSQNLGSSTGDSSTCDLRTSYCGADDFCHELPSAGSPCGEAKYGGLLYCDANSFVTVQLEICIQNFEVV